jgi:GntR family transcriptional regulator/MocR family aminotransferase
VRNKAYIIEDDYDSEFRYTGHPLPSIQGMSADNPVFYLGTFSKVLFPGIRLGYLVLPSIDMMEIFSAVKSITDRFSPTFEQMVLARFIEEGHFTKHIRRMRTLYKERQEFLIHQLNKELGDFLEVKAGEAGMHVIGWLTGSKNDKLISAAAKKIGVTVNTLSDYSIKFPGKPGLLLGYAAFNEKQIKEGVKKICTVFYSTK